MLEHLEPAQEETFFAAAFDYSYFGTPWHYHPEYELVLVEQSAGKRFIGNAVSEFGPGDLTLIGPHLPHLYRNPPAYYGSDPALRAKSIVIHFLERSFGADFLGLPQLDKVRSLFARARQGIDFFGKTREVVIEKMKALLAASGLRRLLLLVEILDVLSASAEYRLISGPGVVGHNALETERLNTVFQFILQHFDKPVQLEEIASRIHMTRSSFCRFFKDHTKRSFSDLLIDIRLGHACKLLVEGKQTITEVAFLCGYNNLSNFNRQFKRKYALTPKEYRDQHYMRIAPALGTVPPL